MRYVVKITFTSISGTYVFSRTVGINANSRQKAAEVARGVGIILDRGTGRSEHEFLPSREDGITLEEAIIWALTGGQE